MENSNEKEEYEDCYEDQNEKEKNEIEENNNKNENNINETKKEEEKEKKELNNEQEEEEEQKEKKEDKYIPYTIKQAQEKSKENNNNDNSSSDEENPKTVLTEEEKKDIEEKIINERKNAGVLYKNGEYIQALNTYNLLLKDAKKAELKEQCCILNCNKGICFNKLNEYDKALESFKDALKYNKDYSKALCNKMLLLNKKEEYLEAYEDFKRLKTLDYNLWENYRNLEGELSYKAEIQKKKMTDEMLGKLKDMGNSILGKFGLSLNNFQMTPNGQGGYSIQYNNNK
jgi:tetratricopeptide (TPR) repeat protein